MLKFIDKFIYNACEAINLGFVEIVKLKREEVFNDK